MSPFNARRISSIRLAVQLLGFLVLLYGGFAVLALAAADGCPAGSPAAQAASPLDPRLAKRPAGMARLYLPNTVCIYQRQGLCEGCSLYFLSSILTWWPPLTEVLPYLLMLLLMMMMLGRLWCGWICPLGLVSDLLTRIRAGLGFDRMRLSRGWRNGLVYSKYGLLFLALGVAVLAGLPGMEQYRLSLLDPFCRVCPSRIFSAFFTFDDICWTDFHDVITAVFTWIGLLAFALVFLGLPIRRLWCRLCPVGGLNTLFNRTGLVSLVKDAPRCTGCGACARSCPVDIRRVHETRQRGVVTAGECTLCLRCVEACPESGCLRFSLLGRKVTGS